MSATGLNNRHLLGSDSLTLSQLICLSSVISSVRLGARPFESLVAVAWWRFGMGLLPVVVVLLPIAVIVVTLFVELFLSPFIHVLASILMKLFLRIWRCTLILLLVDLSLIILFHALVSITRYLRNLVLILCHLGLSINLLTHQASKHVLQLTLTLSCQGR